MVEIYFPQDQVLSFSDSKFLCNVQSEERVLVLLPSYVCYTCSALKPNISVSPTSCKSAHPQSQQLLQGDSFRHSYKCLDLLHVIECTQILTTLAVKKQFV